MPERHSQSHAEWWSFWGGPACGERQMRVAAEFAPSDPEGSAPEHLRIEAHSDVAAKNPVLHVHRYLAAPWPPRGDQAAYWRYVGMTVER